MTAVPQVCVYLAGRCCDGNSCRSKHIFFALQGTRQLHGRMFACCCACDVLSAPVAVQKIAQQVLVRT